MYSVVVFAVLCVIVVGGNILDRLIDQEMGDEVNTGKVVEERDTEEESTYEKIKDSGDKKDKEGGLEIKAENDQELRDLGLQYDSQDELEAKNNKNNLDSYKSRTTMTNGKTVKTNKMLYFGLANIGESGKETTESLKLVPLGTGEEVKRIQGNSSGRLVEYKMHEKHNSENKPSPNHRLVEFRLKESQNLDNRHGNPKIDPLGSKKYTGDIQKYTISNGLHNESVLPYTQLNEPDHQTDINLKLSRALKSQKDTVLNVNTETTLPNHRSSPVLHPKTGFTDSYKVDQDDGYHMSLELSDQPRLECRVAQEEDNSVIRAALLLPNNTDYISALPKVLPVLMLAQAEVHRRQLLPKNLSFQFMPRDDRCDAVYAQLGTFEAAKLNVHVFFGPACEYSVAPVARMIKFWNTPLLTTGALTFDFSRDKRDPESEYHLLLRAGMLSFRDLAFFIIAVLEQFGWGRVMLVYDKDGCLHLSGKHTCKLMMETLVEFLKRRGIHYGSYDLEKNKADGIKANLQREIGYQYNSE